MKRQLCLLGLLFSPCLIQAQNVGIGTTAPTEKLEVKNPLRSTLKISAGNLADTTQLILSNSGSSGFYTDFSIKSVREEGLFFSSRSDFPTYNSANSLVIRPQGNVGIGTNLPAYRLQVHENIAANGYMNITNTTTGSSGTDGLLIGLTGNSATLTNLENGSLQLGTGNLTRVMIDATGNVGIGNSFPAFKLDVSGDMNITGLLRLNSTPGGAGQVLTSNGLADPTWANASFGNNIRFAVSFTGDLSALPIVSTYTTIYNLSPPDISIGVNSITINKSGLYHVEGYSTFTAGSATAPTLLFVIFSMIYDGIIISYADSEPLFSTTPGCCTYKRTFHFSQDIYLTAPAVISPDAAIASNITMVPRLFSGKITAYLINE
jgi:hypothetical protein